MKHGIPEKSIKINGINTSYTDSGGDGSTLLFIHGFPFNKASWEPQVNGLSNKYRVITYDIRGFGKSESGQEQASIDLFASDLLQLIDGLGLKQPAVCGLSMGGYILMNAVCRVPEKIGALVLCDTQCIADSDEGREKRFKTIEKINADGLEPFADGFVQAVLCQETKDTKKNVVEQVKRMILEQQVKSVTNTLKAMADRKESCTPLKHVKVPTLIICGKEDTVTPMSQSELLNNTIGGSQLRSIEKAGHLSNLEQPEEFNAIVSSFVK